MDTYNRLTRILAGEYKLAEDKLQPQARLDELGVDSLGVMELMFKIEDEFGIQVPNEQIALATISDVVDYVNSLIADQAAGAAAPQGGP